MRLKGLIDRFFSWLRRPEPAPAPAAPSPPSIPACDAEDAITFSCAIDGALFVTCSSAGRLYLFGRILDFDIPAGEQVELIAGGPLNPNGLMRVRPDLGPTVHGVTVQAVVEGTPSILRIHEPGEGEAPLVRERPIITGRTAIKATSVAGASAVSIVLAGTGRVTFKSLQFSRVAPKPVAPTDVPAASDPLLALVQPDYLAARKAGAEIPPPPLVSGL